MVDNRSKFQRLEGSPELTLPSQERQHVQHVRGFTYCDLSGRPVECLKT